MADEANSGTAAAPAAPVRPARGSRRKSGAPWTGVVYDHGIGAQRRYEETSRLIDRLDEFSRCDHGDARHPGYVREVQADVEPLRDDCGGKPGDIVGYIDCYNSNDRDRHVRFYEAYWAPVMADVTSAAGVLKWLFQQAVRPIRTLLSPWRERQRLRRSRLMALYEFKAFGSDPASKAANDDFQDLLEAYRDFEDLDKQAHSPKGSFGEFLTFIDETNPQPAKRKRLRAAARRWRAAYVRDELGNLFVLWGMAIFLILAGVAAIALAYNLLQWFAHLMPGGMTGKPVEISTAITLAAGVASGLGLTALLNDYLGDVQAWATYQETDTKNAARNETLERCMTALSHVLRQEHCDRVAIVAHSLGTSVAHDALLALRRRNDAIDSDPALSDDQKAARRVPLHKIEHLVTLGSPIDKIEYFFEGYRSYSHRFKKVVETFRGDIGREPFTSGGKPFIHWINYWDGADIISGALHSPAGERVFIQRVDNVEIASLAFPAPGASHSAYFTHRQVISDLFDIIFRNRWSFASPPPDVEPRNLFIGRTRGFDGRVLVQAAVVLVPWLILARLVVACVPWERVCAAVTAVMAMLCAWSPGSLLTWMLQNAGQRAWLAAIPPGLALAAYIAFGRRQRTPIPPRKDWERKKKTRTAPSAKEPKP